MSSAGTFLPHRTLLGLLLTIGAVAAPHALHLPLWLTALVFACGLWRYMAGYQAWRLPPRWILIPLTLLCATGVALTYGTIAGRDAGVALLTLLVGLKLLEMRSRRDTVVVLFLGYFLVVTQFLFSESLFTAGWMLLMVWAMTALLITVTRPTDGKLSGAHCSLAAGMVLQALPVMLLLFVLFPRIPGPLWGMPESDARGVTGLSNEMTPGAISELSQSDAVAFRVEFDGDPPAASARYWRGPVLPYYDGTTWRRSQSPRSPPPVLETMDGAIDYVVTLEPHNEDWILALDLPVEVNLSARVGGDYDLRRDDPVRERLRYRARSHTNYRLDPGHGADEQAMYLHLPDGAHPRARELARGWRSEADTPRELMERALRHFREEEFVYTLQPPRLRDDPVDEFLFETRRGFCENFAGSFAVLMRAAGVPARVVTGYQGGEINPTGNYLIVRQSDAHAWVEVWRRDEGWLRVDPTAWVAPERIELGLADSIPESDVLPTLSRRDPGLVRHLALRWDAVNAYWDRWVLAYGPDLQRQFMKRVGIDNLSGMLTVLAVGLALVIAVVAAILLWQRPPRQTDPALNLWQELVRRLGRAGLPPNPGEGPRDYVHRVMTQRPDLAPRLRTAIGAYLRLRYGRQAQAADRDALQAAVRHLRP